jgi:cob(I)alamin adenosyltransferase
MARLALLEGTHDLVILDEFPYAFLWGLLTFQEFSEVLASRKPWVEVVLTGRKVPEELLEIADLVSEIRNIRHPLERGIQARRGFEY